MVLVIIAISIYLVLAVLSISRLNKGLREVRWSDCRRADPVTPKAWLPFLRPSISLLPSLASMYFRGVVFVPFQLLVIVAVHLIVLVTLQGGGSSPRDVAKTLRLPLSVLMEWIFGFKLTVSGQRENCACIVSNHGSSLDVYALALVTCSSGIRSSLNPVCCAFLAKAETLKIPVVGRVA